MKPVRKAVRTFLFQGDKVMAIRYKNGNQKGYLVANAYQGEVGIFLENDSMWYLISDAICCKKIFPSVKLLDFLPLSNISLKFLCNEEHEVLSVSNL